MKRDKQEGPDIGAFLLASVLHFYSGRPLHNLSGVDIFAMIRKGQVARSPANDMGAQRILIASLFAIAA